MDRSKNKLQIETISFLPSPITADNYLLSYMKTLHKRVDHCFDKPQKNTSELTTILNTSSFLCNDLN